MRQRCVRVDACLSRCIIKTRTWKWFWGPAVPLPLPLRLCWGQQLHARLHAAGDALRWPQSLDSACCALRCAAGQRHQARQPAADARGPRQAVGLWPVQARGRDEPAHADRGRGVHRRRVRCVPAVLELQVSGPCTATLAEGDRVVLWSGRRVHLAVLDGGMSLSQARMHGSRIMGQRTAGGSMPRAHQCHTARVCVCVRWRCRRWS